MNKNGQFIASVSIIVLSFQGKSQMVEPHVPGRLDKTPTSKLWREVLVQYKETNKRDRIPTKKPWEV